VHDLIELLGFGEVDDCFLPRGSKLNMCVRIFQLKNGICVEFWDSPSEPEWSVVMFMHHGILYESYVFCRKKHTYFRQIKTYAEYYDWVDIFFMCITSVLWLRCAGRRLNDLFRGIPLLE
jgi:hypothetical protein